MSTTTTTTATTTTTTTITDRSSTTSSAAPVTETTLELDQKITEDTDFTDSNTDPDSSTDSSELHVSPSMVKAEANTDSKMDPTIGIVILCVFGVVALVCAIIAVLRRFKKSMRTKLKF